MSEEIRQGVLVAGTLIDQYAGVVRRLLEARAIGNDPEEHVLRAEVERVYGAIWEQLDGAARASRAAGRAVVAYDQIRARPDLDVAVAVSDVSGRVDDVRDEGRFMKVTTEARVVHNKGGVELARAAAASLRDAWPELDWTVHDTPDVDLRPASSKIIGALAKLFGRRRNKIVER
jgi:hypothetical protein